MSGNEQMVSRLTLKKRAAILAKEGECSEHEMALIIAANHANPAEMLHKIIQDLENVLWVIVQECETGIYQPQDALSNISRFARKKL